MYIRVKIDNDEIEFDNKDDAYRALLYRTSTDKSADCLTEQQFDDICSLITHMAKVLKK